MKLLKMKLLQTSKRMLCTLVDTFFFQMRMPWNLFLCKVSGLRKIKAKGYVKFSGGGRLVAEGEGSSIYLESVWCGRDVEIKATDGEKLTIKSGTTIQDGCRLIGQLTIERDVIFAPRAFISSGNHQAFVEPYLNIRHQEALHPVQSHPIHIEEDVWVGVNVFIKSGIYIGRGSIVGANAVVLQDVYPYTLVGGAPSRSVKERYPFKSTNCISSDNKSDWPYFYRGFERPSMKMLDNTCCLYISIQDKSYLKISFIADSNGELRLRSLYFDEVLQFNKGVNNLSLKIFKENQNNIKDLAFYKFSEGLTFITKSSHSAINVLKAEAVL